MLGGGGHQWAIMLILVLPWLLSSVAGWCASSTPSGCCRVRESPSILELLPSEDQALLVRWNTLLVLNLRLDIVDRVRRLDLKGDRLSRESLDKKLHPSMETQDKMGGQPLNVVFGKGAAVLKLLSGKDKTLLVGRDTLLVLDLRLHVDDGVRGLHLEGDPKNCTPSQRRRTRWRVDSFWML